MTVIELKPTPFAQVFYRPAMFSTPKFTYCVTGVKVRMTHHRVRTAAILDTHMCLQHSIQYRSRPWTCLSVECSGTRVDTYGGKQQYLTEISLN